MAKYNIGGQSTPQTKPKDGYYRAPEKPKYAFQMPAKPSSTPNMDSLKASGGVVTKQNSDMAAHLDRARQNKTRGGRGWGGM